MCARQEMFLLPRLFVLLICAYSDTRREKKQSSPIRRRDNTRKSIRTTTFFAITFLVPGFGPFWVFLSSLLLAGEEGCYILNVSFVPLTVDWGLTMMILDDPRMQYNSVICQWTFDSWLWHLCSWLLFWLLLNPQIWIIFGAWVGSEDSVISSH